MAARSANPPRPPRGSGQDRRGGRFGPSTGRGRGRRLAGGEVMVITIEVEGSAREITSWLDRTKINSPGRRRIASGEGVVITIKVESSGRKITSSSKERLKKQSVPLSTVRNKCTQILMLRSNCYCCRKYLSNVHTIQMYFYNQVMVYGIECHWNNIYPWYISPDTILRYLHTCTRIYNDHHRRICRQVLKRKDRFVININNPITTTFSDTVVHD